MFFAHVQSVSQARPVQQVQQHCVTQQPRLPDHATMLNGALQPIYCPDLITLLSLEMVISWCLVHWLSPHVPICIGLKYDLFALPLLFAKMWARLRQVER